MKPSVSGNQVKGSMKQLSRLQLTALVLILLTGAALRFYNYSQWSLSNDELSALNRLQYSGFIETIREGSMKNDMHPPGVQAFLYLWTHIAGNSVAAVRLPFVLAGILSIYIFFLLAKRWIGTNAALCSTAVMASLIFPVLYSQLARPYSPGLLFCLLASLYWTSFIFHRDKSRRSTIEWKYLAAFIISCALCMYTHYFAFLFAGVLGLAGLVFLRRRMLLAWAAAGVMMFVLFLPALPVFIYHLKAGGLGTWLGPPQPDTFIKYIFYIFNESLLLLLIFSGLMLLFLFSRQWKPNRLRAVSLFLFLIPFLIAYFYSIYKNPVYQHSIMIFSFPFLLLFLFSFMPPYNNARSVFLSFVLLIACTVSTVAEKRYYSSKYFGVFKELVQHALINAEKYGKDKITFTANVIMPYYINYYHDQWNKKIDYSIYRTSSHAELAKLNQVVAGSDKDFLSYAWSNTLKPLESDFIIRQHYPCLLESTGYFNSGYRLYSKNMGTTLSPDYTYSTSFEELNEYKERLITLNHTGRYSLKYAPTDEFGPTIRKKLHEFNLSGDSSIIQIRVYAYAEKSLKEPSLVVQVDHNNKTIYWINASLKDYLLQTSQWQPVFLAYSPADLPAEAEISIYIWNPGKEEFYIDDMDIQVFNYPHLP